MTKRTHHRWTENDTRYILRNYMHRSNAEMAEHFGVSLSSMTNQLHYMELNHDIPKGCPPRSINYMSLPVYVPPPSICPREEGLYAYSLPSGTYQPAAQYHDWSHP